MDIYPIAKSNKKPLCDASQYEQMYTQSIKDSDKFWAEQA
ncbi:hypothetical protein BHECKSOX_681, partial [Bathymodiolus heckerae thiotrophic gill symbiont]